MISVSTIPMHEGTVGIQVIRTDPGKLLPRRLFSAIVSEKDWEEISLLIETGIKSLLLIKEIAPDLAAVVREERNELRKSDWRSSCIGCGAIGIASCEYECPVRKLEALMPKVWSLVHKHTLELERPSSDEE